MQLKIRFFHLGVAKSDHGSVKHARTCQNR